MKKIHPYFFGPWARETGPKHGKKKNSPYFAEMNFPGISNNANIEGKNNETNPY